MTSEVILNDNLTKYNRHILNKVILGFDAERDFNIYELVNEAVSYKCILPSMNALVMETYYSIKEYLLSYGFIIEQKEMAQYLLTEKGRELKASGTIEKYEEMEMRRNKHSIFHKFFSKNKQHTSPVNNMLANNYG